MSPSSPPPPPRPSLEHLQKQAKALLKAVKEGDPEAASKFRESRPALSKASDAEIAMSKLSLRDAQRVIAREYDFDKWTDLKKHVSELAQSELVEMQIAKVLVNLSVDLEKVVAGVEVILQPGKGTVEGELRMTPRAWRLLELGGGEASTLGHHHFGTEHVLLGILREGRGAAVEILKGRGVSLDKARDQVKRIIAETRED